MDILSLKKNQQGFTIVEMLITVFVFSILATAVSSIFIQVINGERRALAAQQIQENGEFILESLAREIRVSKIENQDSPGCDLTSLTITHPINGTIIYTVSNGILRRTASNIPTDISASTIEFNRLNFCVSGSGPSDDQTARVTIIASVQNKTGRDILTFNLQTTVTSRNVDTEF
jgi:prepilin-type N-terminal cleavage/methylation domain-containing protein